MAEDGALSEATRSKLAGLWDLITKTQIPLGKAQYGLGVDVNDVMSKVLLPFSDNRAPAPERPLPESFSMEDLGKLISILPHMADVKAMAEGQVEAQHEQVDPNEPYGAIKHLFKLLPMLGVEGGGAVAPAAERGSTTLGAGFVGKAGEGAPFTKFGDFTVDGRDLLRNGEKVGTIKLRVENGETPHVVVDDIEITRKGEGTGSAALQALTAEAQAQGMGVGLTSDAMRGKQAQARQRDLYQRLGFEKTRGAGKVPGVDTEFYRAPPEAPVVEANPPESPPLSDAVPPDPSSPAPVARRDLFDYSQLHQVPDVPQFDLPRNVPARGPSARVQALDDKKVVKKINEVVKRGAEAGAPWYNTEPLRKAFVDQLGEEEGARRYALYMDMVAATSPRSDVGTNARNASYYYQQALQGGQPAKPLPKPYGHMAQDLHLQNYRNVVEAGGMGPEGSFPILDNPKPPSFSQNLQGNQQPVTADTHYARLWGSTSKNPEWLLPSFKVDKDAAAIRPRDLVTSGEVKMKDVPPVWWDSMPKANEYPMLEMLGQREAKKLGMTPAQYQASAWVGGGENTGLASGADPFLRHFENRVILTAQKTGLTPNEVLAKFIKGEISLLSPPVVPHAGKGDEGDGDDREKLPAEAAPAVPWERLLSVL